MYIKTDGYGLINLKYCQGVEVYKVSDGYKLRAIPSADSRIYSKCFGTIAIFQDEADASYIASKIFEALALDESTWDAGPGRLLEILWDKIKERLPCFSPYEALDEMLFWASVEHEVTIICPPKFDSGENRILQSERDKVVSQLSKTIKTGNPVEVKWKSYDPESDIPF
jgi:hypothetical protein